MDEPGARPAPAAGEVPTIGVLDKGLVGLSSVARRIMGTAPVPREQLVAGQREGDCTQGPKPPEALAMGKRAEAGVVHLALSAPLRSSPLLSVLGIIAFCGDGRLALIAQERSLDTGGAAPAPANIPVAVAKLPCD